MTKLNLGTKNCLQCGKEIKLKIRRDLERKKFCSRSCSSKYNDTFRGIWDNPEIRERMRKNMRKPHRITEALLLAAKERGLKRLKIKGKYIICQQCGKRFWMFESRIDGRIGKNGQIQSRKFCSRKCQGLFRRKPEELKVDKTRLAKWRKLILERDNYRCVKCGETNVKIIQATHIKSKEDYPNLRYDLTNGRILCLKCHAEESPKRLQNLILSFEKIGSNIVLKDCQNCGKKYYRKPSQIGKFCNHNCYIKSITGKPNWHNSHNLSIKHKKAISNGLIKWHKKRKGKPYEREI